MKNADGRVSIVFFNDLHIHVGTNKSIFPALKANLPAMVVVGVQADNCKRDLIHTKERHGVSDGIVDVAHSDGYIRMFVPRLNPFWR